MKKLELSFEEKKVLVLAIDLLNEHYDARENKCRDFKWICHDHLPQAGEGYVANKNVFDIQDKTIADIKNSKGFASKTIMKIINGS